MHSRHFNSGVLLPLLTTLMVDATITDLQFGVGLTSSTVVGVMGIGYDIHEAITFLNLSSYPNLIDQMLYQGLVLSRTYSLYLNDLEASTGTILFGGVDLEGFSGTLQTLPINPPSQGPLSEFFITLTGINLTPPCGHSTPVGLPSSFPTNAILDSGTSFIILPTAIADTIASGLGAIMDDLGIYNLPNCDLQFADGFLDFDFSGVKIRVPYSEFIIKDLFQNGSNFCSLGLQAINSTCVILGDTFLRSAYVVYDLVCSLFFSC